MRTELLEAYRALPLPTTRDEHWRFTDLAGFDPDAFAAARQAREHSQLFTSMRGLPELIEAAARTGHTQAAADALIITMRGSPLMYGRPRAAPPKHPAANGQTRSDQTAYSALGAGVPVGPNCGTTAMDT